MWCEKSTLYVRKSLGNKPSESYVVGTLNLCKIRTSTPLFPRPPFRVTPFTVPRPK